MCTISNVLSNEKMSELLAIREILPEGEEQATETPVQEAYEGRTYSMDIVSITAYLIGVYADKYETKYKKTIYESLDQNEDAHIMRNLCMIRNCLMHQPGKISQRLNQGLCNLDTIPEYIDPELFAYLRSHRVNLINGSGIKPIVDYVALINNEISNRMNRLSGLYPGWINFEYIRDMIRMPSGGNKQKIQAAINTLGAKCAFYPYGCYINWPVDNPKMLEEYALETAELEYANILLHDRKFCVLLYRVNGEEFTAYHRVTDVSRSTKQVLQEYLAKNDNITMLVDCENSDPFKLCAFFEGVREMRREAMAAEERLGNITRVILYDDFHTIDTWDVLKDYVNVELVHNEVERVLGHKSLVDIAMTAGACREHYRNGVDAIIIASSDSDFIGLMRDLEDVSFLVLAERSKSSNGVRSAYEEQGVARCFIDDFSGNLTRIREGAICHSIEKRLNDRVAANLRDTIADVSQELNLSMSEAEQASWAGKELRVVIGEDGSIQLKLVA